MGRMSHSIYVKVFLVILLLVLPLNVSALLESNKALLMTLNQVCQSQQNLADIRMSELADRMKAATSLMHYFITEDADCIEMCNQEIGQYSYNSAKMKFYVKLKNMVSMTDGADGYIYYMQDADEYLAYGSSKEINSIQEIVRQEIVQQPEGSQKMVGWHLFIWDDVEYLVYCFFQNQVVYGAWMNLSGLREQLCREIGYRNIRVSFAEERMPADYRALTVTSHAKNIWLGIQLDSQEVYKGLSMYQKGIWVLMFLFILIIPVLYVVLKGMVLQPLEVMNKAHRELQGGNQDYRITERGRAIEYEEAFQGFNRMADNLKTFRILAYEREIARQKMELQNLQLQIRPHFLLNTFNLIHVLAMQKNTDSIQNIILYLSNYFRYIFRSGKELELFSKEFELIQGYIEMASIRYHGRVEFDFELEPEIMFVRIPPLLIHNFVENAVKYGMKEGCVLHISLMGEYRDKTVFFSVLDDGNGMDEDILESNRKMLRGERESENSGAHLGLYNSYRRLKYFYGEEAGISVESQLGEMTLFKISFPYNMEVENDTSDCE